MAIEIPGEPKQEEPSRDLIQVMVTLNPATGEMGFQTNLSPNPMNMLVVQGILDNAKNVAKGMGKPQQPNIALPPVAMNGRRF